MKTGSACSPPTKVPLGATDARVARGSPRPCATNEAMRRPKRDEGMAGDGRTGVRGKSRGEGRGGKR